MPKWQENEKVNIVHKTCQISICFYTYAVDKIHFDKRKEVIVMRTAKRMMKKKNIQIDMTKGSVLKAILFFAIPLFLSNLFQQFYNLADTAIVGHILGDHALSAVGSVSTIYSLFTVFCFGLTSGFSILLSQYFGSDDEKSLKKGIAASVELAFLTAVILTVFSTVFMKQIMRAIHVSDSLFADAYDYILIITLGLIVNVAYNLLSSVLRAVGNSKTPLLFLTISSFLNIFLDILFIKGLGLGIAGAAYATVLAQAISATLCFVYINVYCRELIPCKEDFAIPGIYYKKLLSYGSSMAFMYTIINIGTLILQIGINGLGNGIVAAHITARKISELLMMPVSTVAGAMATFTSQNYGAGKNERIKDGVRIGCIILFVWSTLSIVIVYSFGSILVRALTGTADGEIIRTAVRYLRINLPYYYALSALCLFRNVLQGISHNGFTLFASFLEMAGKVITVAFFVERFGYMAVCYCEPISWIICCIPVIAALRHYLYAGSFEKPRVSFRIARRKSC